MRLINYKEVMQSILRSFMDNGNEADIINPILDKVGKYIQEIRKGDILEINVINTESRILEVVQNFTEVEITGNSFESANAKNCVLDFYKHINLLRFEKGYISENQFEYNQIFVDRLALVKPKSWWK